MIPLIFMIQMERIEFIHSFLFSLVAELVPEITGSKKVIIVSDGEKAIYQCYIQNMDQHSNVSMLDTCMEKYET